MFYNLIRSSTKRKGHKRQLAIKDSNERIIKEGKLNTENKEMISYRSSVKLRRMYGI